MCTRIRFSFRPAPRLVGLRSRFHPFDPFEKFTFADNSSLGRHLARKSLVPSKLPAKRFRENRDFPPPIESRTKYRVRE